MLQYLLKGSFIPILFSGIILNLNAQEDNSETMRFTLEEAVNYALDNNINVRNADLDLERARKEVWKTTAIGLPQANVALDYQHLPGDLPTARFPDPDGGFQEIALGVKNSTTYSLTVSQLVFSGEYIVGLQASKTFLKLSENSLEKVRLNTRSNVSSSYYTVLILEGSLETLKNSLANNRKLLEETKAMVETGFASETDAGQLEIVVNTLENGIKRTERQIELAYRLLKINLGLDKDVEVNLTQNIDELLKDISFNTIISEDFILENNIDYRSILTNERISELTLKREHSKFLPTLSAFYLYQDKTNKADFDFTFNHILGLSVALPIFSSGQRVASVSQARIDLAKTINSKEQLEQNLFMSFDQARKDFNTAWESYNIQIKNVELSERIYNQTQIKYKEGVASSLELTQVHDQYLNAVTAYTNAALNLLNAKLALEIILSN